MAPKKKQKPKTSADKHAPHKKQSLPSKKPSSPALTPAQNLHRDDQIFTKSSEQWYAGSVLDKSPAAHTLPKPKIFSDNSAFNNSATRINRSNPSLSPFNIVAAIRSSLGVNSNENLSENTLAIDSSNNSSRHTITSFQTERDKKKKTDKLLKSFQLPPSSSSSSPNTKSTPKTQYQAKYHHSKPNKNARHNQGTRDFSDFVDNSPPPITSPTSFNRHKNDHHHDKNTVSRNHTHHQANIDRSKQNQSELNKLTNEVRKLLNIK